MKFKKSTTKETPKRSTSTRESKTESSLTKEEIKEIVEETVEETLKEQKEPQAEDQTVSPSSTSSSSPDEETSETAKQEESSKEDEESTVAKETIVTPVSIEPNAIIDNSGSTAADEKSEGSAEENTDEPDITASQTGTPSSATAVISVSGVGVTPPTGITPQTSSVNSEPSQNKKSPLILLFIVFVICGFVVGISILFVLSKNNFKLPNVLSVVKQAPTPTSVAVVTPTSEPVDVAKYKIRVLNGSGVAGAAAQTKDDLTAAGFTVDSTGNATDDVTDTTIAAKSSVDAAILSKLSETLSKKYTVSSQALSLQSSEDADVIVTIGTAK